MFPDFCAKKEIQQLPVHCKYEQFGCTESMPWKNLDVSHQLICIFSKLSDTTAIQHSRLNDVLFIRRTLPSASTSERSARMRAARTGCPPKTYRCMWPKSACTRRCPASTASNPYRGDLPRYVYEPCSHLVACWSRNIAAKCSTARPLKVDLLCEDSVYIAKRN